jgi:hypothetical protein
VTFSGGGGSGAAAYARIGSDVTVKGLGTNLDFSTPNGTGLRVLDGGQTSAAYWSVGGGANAVLRTVGNAAAVIDNNNAQPISFRTATSSEQLRVAHTASAGNFVQVTGGVTAGGIATSPTIGSQGSDTNVSLNLNGKGNGGVRIGAQRTNFITVSGSGSGGGLAIFTAEGGDTNISVVLQPKGTGALQAQQTDSTATGGNARGANAVDWQTSRNNQVQVASGQFSFLGSGFANTASGPTAVVVSGTGCNSTGFGSFVGSGNSVTASGLAASAVGGQTNTASGYFGFVGGGELNSTTSNSAVTTQSGTMNGTTAVTLSGSNAAIRVGQIVVGTSIASYTYVAAISGTSLTLSRVASGSSTSTLSFFTPHGVVVGGGNNQATGSYSFIGGGGDAGTAANRNVASGDWSAVLGGARNTASGAYAVVAGGGAFAANSASGTASFVAGGWANNATNQGSATIGGNNNFANGVNSASFGGAYGSTRGITGNSVFPASNSPIAAANGVSQAAVLVLGVQTTDATATALRSDTAAAGTINQVILPNNSAYYFRGTVIANVTGGGNTKSWTIEGAIKRGANAASTTLVGVTVMSPFGDVGAATWTIAAAADTTNGGLQITFTGQASTTIRCVCKLETTEVTF